jgi:transcription antitermination factor NusG
MAQNPANQKEWHVITTRSRAEKKVHADLTAQQIESFLPLQKKLRQWKDRKKWIEMPLITGYCFVNIDRHEYEKVLNTNNVVSYVKFEGKPAQVPASQINFLKKMLSQADIEIEISHENFHPGKRVEIIDGPLIGIHGELISCRGKNRFLLRIKQMNTACLVEITAEKLALLQEKLVQET